MPDGEHFDRQRERVVPDGPAPLPGRLRGPGLSGAGDRRKGSSHHRGVLRSADHGPLLGTARAVGMLGHEPAGRHRRRRALCAGGARRAPPAPPRRAGHGAGHGQAGEPAPRRCGPRLRCRTPRAGGARGQPALPCPRRGRAAPEQRSGRSTGGVGGAGSDRGGRSITARTPTIRPACSTNGGARPPRAPLMLGCVALRDHRVADIDRTRFPDTNSISDKFAGEFDAHLPRPPRTAPRIRSAPRTSRRREKIEQWRGPAGTSAEPASSVHPGSPPQRLCPTTKGPVMTSERPRAWSCPMVRSTPETCPGLPGDRGGSVRNR